MSMRKLGLVTQTIQVVVAFHDVDALAIVWHGHYLKYLENARWALMDRLGYGYAAMAASGYSWPIIEAHVRYVRAAKFGDRLDVTASLIEWHNRLAINYLITDSGTGTRVVRARTVQVAVERVTGEMQFVSPAPFVRRIEASVAPARP
jgi:acyl-CoA thioester hydrolase